MNKKGQMEVGGIIVAAITIIVGVILFVAIAQEVGSSTSTITLANLTLGTQTNGTTTYLTAYRAISNVVIVGNGSTPLQLSSGNYTITNNVIDPTTGGLSVSILPTADLYSGTGWNISGTAQATDYIADSAGRAIAGLIAVFFALAILVVALTPTLRGGVLNLIGK